MILFDKFKQIIAHGAAQTLTDREFLELELIKWETSPPRAMMLTGEFYYSGEHDILKRKRKAIGDGGNMVDIQNLPNNKIIDNQYSKMVDQKTGYLLSKPATFTSDNDVYNDELKKIFNWQFDVKLKNILTGAYNCGVEWLHVYYNGAGDLCFKRFPGYEIMPLWADAEHTELDCAVRLYLVEAYDGKTPTIIKKVEVYKRDGVERYIFNGGKLIPDIENPSGAYMTINGQPFGWERVPLICFKANDKEIPLIKKVKCLQDALNELHSDYKNGMDENAGGNGILVIKNYDGQDLGEFRRNLMTYRAIKVRSVDNIDGGVESINVEVNATNYETIVKSIKKALIENAMGYDAKDDRLGGNANQLNIMSMYSDIDLDADNTEAEFKMSLNSLLWFVTKHLANTGKGDFSGVPVEIIFNRDFILNESEVVADLVKLGVKVSNKTLLSQLPFVDDVAAEIENIEEEEETAVDNYANAFNRSITNNDIE